MAEQIWSGRFSMYNPTVFLRGPKFQIEMSRISGWRVRDDIMETRITAKHAHEAEYVLENNARASTDKHLMNQRETSTLIAKQAQLS